MQYTQSPQKLNILFGSMCNTVIGFFLHIVAIENVAFNYVRIYEEDGASSHVYVPVREYLDEIISCRWFWCRGHIEWPAVPPTSLPLIFLGCCKGSGIFGKNH